MLEHQGNLCGDPAQEGDAVVRHGPQGGLGRPPAQEVRRAAAPQVAGQLRHRPQVGEGRGRQSARPSAPAVADVDGGHGVELPVAEQDAFGKARGSGREHQGHGPVRIVGQVRRGRATDAPAFQHLLDGDRGAHVGLAQHQRGRGHIEYRLLLGVGEAGVHAGRDRTELGRRQVTDEVLGNRRQRQGEHVGRANPPPREADGDLVGDLLELRVGENRPVLGDVCRRVAEAPGRLVKT